MMKNNIELASKILALYMRYDVTKMKTNIMNPTDFHLKKLKK